MTVAVIYFSQEIVKVKRERIDDRKGEKKGKKKGKASDLVCCNFMQL